MKLNNYFKISFLLVFFQISNMYAQSQTESYLTQIDPFIIDMELNLEEGSLSNESTEKYMPIIDQVIEKEKLHSDTHFAFYHTQPLFFYILQQTYKKLLCILKRDCWRDFEYLRPKNLLFHKLQSIDEFFDFKQESAARHNGDISDHNPEIRAAMMATNLSFPGVLMAQESSFFMFIRPTTQFAFADIQKNYHLFMKSALMEISPLKNLSQELITFFSERLVNLNKILEKRVSQGLLLQVMVPKGLVDTYAYLSSDYGYPFGQNIKETPETIRIRKKYPNNPELWTNPETKIQKLFPDIWNKEKNRLEKISPILEAYQNNIEIFDFDLLASMQARVVMDKELFSSPDTGVLIYTYHMIDEETLRDITNDIDQIINEVLLLIKR